MVLISIISFIFLAFTTIFFIKPYLKVRVNINSVNDYYKFVEKANKNNKSYAYMVVSQNCDLDFENKEVESVSSFFGTYDGNGYSIKNIRISANPNTGMFGLLGTDSEIRNVHLESGYMEVLYSGAIASSSTNEFNRVINCVVEPNLVIKGIRASSIVDNFAGHVYNCAGYGTVIAEEGAYGICAYSATKADSCSSHLEISRYGKPTNCPNFKVSELEKAMEFHNANTLKISDITNERIYVYNRFSCANNKIGLAEKQSVFSYSIGEVFTYKYKSMIIIALSACLTIATTIVIIPKKKESN